MQLEIHLLQSFPPANLNRDENGMPKSTVFGGRPRARISSQCQKRATREYYHQYSGLDPGLFAKRSKEWVIELASKLEDNGIDTDKAQLAASCSMSVFTEKKDGKGKLTKSSKVKKGKGQADQVEDEINKADTSLFLGNTEFQSILNFLLLNWQEVEANISSESPALSKRLLEGIQGTVKGDVKPGDVALFGRMMANLPSGKVYAASQVAHAISVHTVEQEFDYFTAVDELAGPNSTGAAHIGETGYNSSTYYRFAIVDVAQLEHNLNGQDSLEEILRAFSEAFIEAVPKGFRNSFAPHTRPAVVLMVVRKGQPISLVNAFEDPVRPSHEGSLLSNALVALDKHWAGMVQMYGDKSIVFKGISVCDDRRKMSEQLDSLSDVKKKSVDELLDEAIKAALKENEEKGS